MTRKAKKYLFDITTAIDNIFLVHLGGIDTKEGFAENLTIQRAIEREVGIIGEACHQLQKLQIQVDGADSMRQQTQYHCSSI